MYLYLADHFHVCWGIIIHNFYTVHNSIFKELKSGEKKSKFLLSEAILRNPCEQTKLDFNATQSALTQCVEWTGFCRKLSVVTAKHHWNWEGKCQLNYTMCGFSTEVYKINIFAFVCVSFLCSTGWSSQSLLRSNWNVSVCVDLLIIWWTKKWVT